MSVERICAKSQCNMAALEADYIAEYDMVMITDERHESTGASVRRISRFITALYCVKLEKDSVKLASFPPLQRHDTTAAAHLSYQCQKLFSSFSP